ncbi:MAG: hypothetical protein IPP85_17545 [Propionivibrio sp.]|nr:hypothetical protein [Propionivibrio sp.]
MTLSGDKVFLSGGAQAFADGSVISGRLNLSGATATFGNTTANGLINYTGGSLGIGAGDTLTANGRLDWATGNAISGPGTLAIPTGETLALLTTADRVLDNVRLDNAGIISSAMGTRNLFVNNGAVINNSGLYQFQSGSNDAINTSGGGGTFNNTGTIESLSPNANLINVAFNNTGGTLAASGANNLTINAPSNFSGALTLSGNNVFLSGGAQAFADGSSVSGRLNLSGATATFGSTTVNGLINYTAGSLGIGSGDTLTAAGGLNWATGNAISGPGTLAIPTGQTLALTTISDRVLDNARLDNAGTISSAMGTRNLFVNNGAVINNSGLYQFQSGSNDAINRNSGVGTFNNTGTLESLSANANLISVAFNNTGGTLAASGANNLTINAPSNFSGALTLSGNNVFLAGGAQNFADGSVISGLLNLSGAAATFGSTTVNGLINYTAGSLGIGAGDTLTAAGGLNWATGNAISGPGTLAIPTGQTLALTTISDRVLDNARLDNAGTISSAMGSRNLFVNNGAVINNSGLYQFQSGSNDAINRNSGAGTFNNTGSIDSQSAGAAVVGVTLNNTGGTLSNGTSANLSIGTTTTHSGALTISGNNVFLSGGAQAFADGSSVSGLLNLSGATATFGSTMVNGLINYTGGTLGITNGDTLTANGGLNWATGNAISGPGTLSIPTGQTLALTTTADRVLDNVTLNNAGTISSAMGSRNLYVNNGAVINNSGLYQFQSGSNDAINRNSGAGTFNNTGSIDSQSAGAAVANVTLNNTGGTLAASGANNLTIAAGGTHGDINLVGNGVAFTSGTHTIGGQVIAGVGSSFNVSGATMNFADNSVFNLTGNLNFSSGAINLTGTGTGATVATGSTLTLNSKTLGGSGKLTNLNLATFNFNNSSIAGTLINQGTLNINSGSSAINGASFDLSGGSVNIASGATLTKNGGAFNWSGGALSGAGNFIPSGGAVVNVNGLGALVLDGPNLNADSFNIAGGGTLDVLSGSLGIAGGNLASGSTLTLSGGTFTNSGALNVAGTLDLAGGTLLGAGTLNVSGTLEHTGVSPTAIPNVLNNTGLVVASNGTLSLEGGGTHTGTFLANNSATIDFQSGTHNFADGTVFSGPGNFDGGGVLNVTGSTSGLQFAAGTTINLNALALGGSGNLTNLGSVSGSSLTLPGNFTNQAGASANFTDVTIAGNLYNRGDFTTGGVVTVAGPVAQQLGGVMTLPAGSTLDMTNPAGVFSWVDGTIGGTGTLGFSGGGTFLFAGTGNRVIDGLNFSFNNLTLPDGSLTLQSGSLTLSGATVLPAGVALNLFGGTLTNNGSLDVAGAFSLTGGAFGGTGSLSMSGGSLSLPAGNSVAWTNSGTLTNTGTLNLASSTITNAIDNLGTINLGGGLVFTQIVTNTGTIDAQVGNALFANGLVQNAGNIVLTGGSLQGDVSLNAGSLSGTGTVNGNVLIGNATIAPGFSPGAITITGNLNLGAASVLNIELGGLAQGTGYDWINVLGTANLAGTLNVSSYGAYIPAAGSSYSFMSFGSSSGNFASTNLLSGISLNSFAGYLELLMAGGSTPGLSPLQSFLFDAFTVGRTVAEFNRMLINDTEIPIDQMFALAALSDEKEAELLGLKQCQ